MTEAASYRVPSLIFTIRPVRCASFSNRSFRENGRAQSTLWFVSETPQTVEGGKATKVHKFYRGHPKRGPNISQKQPQRLSESKKTLGRRQGKKKSNFGRPGPPSRAPRGPQIGPPNGAKSTQEQRFTPYTKRHRFGGQYRGHRLSLWEEKWKRFEYMSGDAHRQEPNLDFQRMYCTVCLFLQAKLFENRNEKQSERAPFHIPHKPTCEDRKKGPKKPPKGSPEPSSETLRRTPQRPPKPITLKNHFLRRRLPGGFGVYLPRDPEMGPRLYRYIYIYSN